jgi:hypothetical protein
MKGFVYTIRSKSSELVYYGSTLEKMLSNRMSSHRSHYKRWLAYKGNNCTSFQILELGDAYIELVEDVDVETRQHLRALEGKYQRENTCVNMKHEGQTPAENKAYRAAYKATHKEAQAAYSATPEARLKQAAYRATHKEVQAAYSATPEARIKQAAYRATHKAVKAAYNATPEAKAARAAYNAAYRLKKAALLN